MKLQEMMGNNDPKLQALLDVVAKVVPYVGYEANAANGLADELADAFEAYAGMSWADWKKQNEPVLRKGSRTVLGRGMSKEALARDTEESDREYIEQRQKRKRQRAADPRDSLVKPYERD